MSEGEFRKLSKEIINFQRKIYKEVLKHKESFVYPRLDLALEDFAKYNGNITSLRDSIVNTILYL